MAPKKTFTIDDQPVSSGGVILYRAIDERLELLLSYTRNNYEDLGGKADPEDHDIHQTVSRETEEETNRVILASSVLDRLRLAKPVYTPRSKYLVYLLEASPEESRLRSEQFGETELHDGFERTISWVPATHFLSPKCPKNWRLRNAELNRRLRQLQEDLKGKSNDSN
jgi:8-oxo-dGTP pyrophosphatase MutT (NUDIX family)